VTLAENSQRGWRACWSSMLLMSAGCLLTCAFLQPGAGHCHELKRIQLAAEQRQHRCASWTSALRCGLPGMRALGDCSGVAAPATDWLP
jgi:hypothetical protein